MNERTLISPSMMLLATAGIATSASAQEKTRAEVRFHRPLLKAEQIMKLLVYLTLAAGALTGPALSYAQSSSAPLTRAQVRADLIRVEEAGYDPSAHNDPYYPADIQAAEAKAAAQDDQKKKAIHSVGGTAQEGSSQAGKPATDTLDHSLDFGQ